MLQIDTHTCSQCGLCAQVCPLNLFAGGRGQVPTFLEDKSSRCIHCGHCFAVCPTASITLDGVAPASSPSVLKAPLDADQRSTLFRTRRSVRVFKPDLVARELLHEALEDASYAPTAINKQNVEWILVEGAAQIQTLLGQTAAWLEACSVPHYAPFLADYRAGIDSILRGARQVIFAYTPSPWMWGPQDASAAISYLELSLHSRGVGTCWAGIVKNAIASGQISCLPLPADCTVHGGLMLGYPDLRYARVPVRKAVRLHVL